MIGIKFLPVVNFGLRRWLLAASLPFAVIYGTHSVINEYGSLRNIKYVYN